MIDSEIIRTFKCENLLTNKVFNFDGCEIHTQYMPCSIKSDTLIVRFHGSINRERRPLPTFQPNLKAMQAYAHQITVCDPTMMSREGFSLGWYSGHEELDTQNILRRFFIQIKLFLGIRRIIYLGSSGGGFAALHYSFFDPASIALVMAPQTSIGAYWPVAVRRYLDNWWSGVSIEKISDKIETDMCRLYRDGHQNSVVYIQSSGDTWHSSHHMAPMINAAHAAGTRENGKFLLFSDFWARHGHDGAIPSEGYINWLVAAISTKTLSGTDLLDAYVVAAKKPVRSTSTNRHRLSNNTPDEITRHEASLRLADLLRDYHLRQTLES